MVKVRYNGEGGGMAGMDCYGAVGTGGLLFPAPTNLGGEFVRNKTPLVLVSPFETRH